MVPPALSERSHDPLDRESRCAFSVILRTRDRILGPVIASAVVIETLADTKALMAVLPMS